MPHAFLHMPQAGRRRADSPLCLPAWKAAFLFALCTPHMHTLYMPHTSLSLTYTAAAILYFSFKRKEEGTGLGLRHCAPALPAGARGITLRCAQHHVARLPGARACTHLLTLFLPARARARISMPCARAQRAFYLTVAASFFPHCCISFISFPLHYKSMHAPLARASASFASRSLTSAAPPHAPSFITASSSHLIFLLCHTHCCLRHLFLSLYASSSQGTSLFHRLHRHFWKFGEDRQMENRLGRDLGIFCCSLPLSRIFSCLFKTFTEDGRRGTGTASAYRCCARMRTACAARAAHAPLFLSSLRTRTPAGMAWAHAAARALRARIASPLAALFSRAAHHLRLFMLRSISSSSRARAALACAPAYI